jgi:hypothetical protein
VTITIVLLGTRIWRKITMKTEVESNKKREISLLVRNAPGGTFNLVTSKQVKEEDLIKVCVHIMTLMKFLQRSILIC